MFAGLGAPAPPPLSAQLPDSQGPHSSLQFLPAFFLLTHTECDLPLPSSLCLEPPFPPVSCVSTACLSSLLSSDAAPFTEPQNPFKMSDLYTESVGTSNHSVILRVEDQGAGDQQGRVSRIHEGGVLGSNSDSAVSYPWIPWATFELHLHSRDLNRLMEEASTPTPQAAVKASEAVAVQTA